MSHSNKLTGYKQGETVLLDTSKLNIEYVTPHYHNIELTPSLTFRDFKEKSYPKFLSHQVESSDWRGPNLRKISEFTEIFPDFDESEIIS